MWYISKIDVMQANCGVLHKFSVPCIRYDFNLCGIVDNLVLEFREFGSDKVKKLACNGAWDKFGNDLHSIAPYGFMHTPEDLKRRSFGMLVVYDELSYRFLEYVDQLSMVSQSVIDDSPFWGFVNVNVFRSLDEYGTMMSFFDRTQFRGGFPLLHVVTSLPQNWHEDGNFYIHMYGNSSAIYRLDFYDKSKARQFVSKSTLIVGQRKLLDGKEALRRISHW